MIHTAVVQGLLHNRNHGLQLGVFRGQGNRAVNYGEEIFGYYIIVYIECGFCGAFVKKGVGLPGFKRMVSGSITVHLDNFIPALQIGGNIADCSSIFQKAADQRARTDSLCNGLTVRQPECFY